MSDHQDDDTYTAFVGARRLAGGPLGPVSTAVQAEAARGATHIVILSDRTGQTIDPASIATAGATDRPGRGRPKLGVTAREVTLLPRESRANARTNDEHSESALREASRLAKGRLLDRGGRQGPALTA